MRVAAAQFETGIDVDENLRTCLRILDKASEIKPDLVVFPEFCNALSWYDNMEHAKKLSLKIEGDFLSQISLKCKTYKFYLVISVTLLNENEKMTVSSLLFDREGEIVRRADKQTMMGHENDFFERASKCSSVFSATDIEGKIQIYQCRDGVTFETPRCLSLDYGQISCCSLNSFAFDEASLHIPARAVENKVFVVASNKVGPLIPREVLEPVSQAINIPAPFLYGAGESQIISPRGEILARASRDKEEIVYADINPVDADFKIRPDGTDIFKNRRPEIYSLLSEEPNSSSISRDPGAQKVQAAVLQFTSQTDALMDLNKLLSIIEKIYSETSILVVPELSCIDEPSNLSESINLSKNIVTKIQEKLREKATDLIVATSIIEGRDNKVSHLGVMISKEGILFKQKQTHKSGMYPWINDFGDEINVFKTRFGNVCMIIGQDIIFPEVTKMAAIQDADVVITIGNFLEKWEIDYGIPSRSAENRVCVLSGSRSVEYRSMIADLETEFTILTDWKERKWNGTINQPIIFSSATSVIEQYSLVIASIHPSAAVNKMMSKNTDLIQGRPWRLCQRITKSEK